MAKKALLMLLLSSCLLGLPAVSYSVEGGAYSHKSSIYGTVTEASVTAMVEDFSFGLMVGEDDYLSFDSKWDYVSPSSSLRTTIGTSIDAYWGDGGLWTLYGDIGQDFRLMGWLSLKYRLGVQGGISWSPFSPKHAPLSLSPYAYWAIGFDNDVFRLEAYGAGMRMYEHTFQAPPVLGIYSEVDLDAHNSLIVDSWMKLADYMDGPDLVISDMALRLSYRWRSL